MAPDDLKAARSRYSAAYEAYQKAATPVAQKFSSGQVPSVEEVEAETDAIVELTIAKRILIDVTTRVAPPWRHLGAGLPAAG
jgi:hypothetical protein